MNPFAIFASAVLLITITMTGKVSTEPTTQSSTYIEPKRQSCCTFKKFTCNNITSPSYIICNNETAHLIMLLPHESPDDEFTLILNNDSSSQQKQLVTVDHNYTEPQFCVGWRNDDNNTLYEAAVVCFSTTNLQENRIDEENLLVFTISGICLLCSVFFSSATLAVYFLLPQLRDLQGKIIISMLISICIGYSMLGCIQFIFDVSNTICIITGFMVYYWCFATFTWLHISCFNIWRTVVLSQSRFKIFKKPNVLFASYSLFAWGVPALFLITALMIEFLEMHHFNKIKPRMGESGCWFHSRQAIWAYFYSPMLVIILSNIYYFISVVIHLKKMHKDEMSKKAASNRTTDTTKTSKSSKIKLRRLNMIQKNKLYLKLFFAMGVTFIFELISDLYLNNMPVSLVARIIFQIMDIVNALQGLILFIVLILTRRKVLEALYDKFKIPIRYLPFKNDKADVDEETQEQHDEEEEDNQDFTTDNDKQYLTNGSGHQQQSSSKITEHIQMT